MDLLFVDGEDYGDFTKTPKDVLIGSRYYAAHQAPGPQPLYAVLFDLVADKDLQIFQEGNSLVGAPEVVELVWDTAKDLGYAGTFVATPKHTLIDDHLELQKAGIRAIDVVDFDYPSWHTKDDTIDKVSAASLQIVGDVAVALVRQGGTSSGRLTIVSPRVPRCALCPGPTPRASLYPPSVTRDCYHAPCPPPSAARCILLLSLGLVGQGVRWWLTRPGRAPGEVQLLAALPPRSPAAHRDSILALARPLGPDERIDADRASAAELARLPRVGLALAKRIVADREAHGPFGGPAGLDRVAGRRSRPPGRPRPAPCLLRPLRPGRPACR